MPHDIFGTELNVGDLIYIPAIIKVIQQSEDYCNITVETRKRMPTGNTQTSLTLNSKQVVHEKNKDNNKFPI